MNWTKGWAAPSRSDPVLELLEDRRLFAAQPVVTFDGFDATLIGETARITVTLSSALDGSPGSDAGYSPYIDLILLTKAADGSASDVNPAQIKDDAAFQRAPLNGQSAQATQTEVDSSGTAIHQFARDQNCDLGVAGPGDYGAQPGGALVVPCLPFGSYAPSQPAAFVSGSAPRRWRTCMSRSPFRRPAASCRPSSYASVGATSSPAPLASPIAASRRAARGRRSPSGLATGKRQPTPSPSVDAFAAERIRVE